MRTSTDVEAGELALAVPGLEAAAQRQGGQHGALRVVGLLERCAEERHRGVADELVEGAAELEHGVRGEGEELAEEARHVRRVHGLAAGGEADDVGEQHGDVAGLVPLGVAGLRCRPTIASTTAGEW